MKQYNSRHYQYSLAGPTPNGFNLYTQVGVYSLDEYYGVKSSELDEQKKLIDVRIASARKRSEEECLNERQKRECEHKTLVGIRCTIIIKKEAQQMENKTTLNHISNQLYRFEAVLRAASDSLTEADQARLLIETAREMVWTV